MKHSELVTLTTQLIEKSEIYSKEFNSFATTSFILEPRSAIDEVGKVFFKNLLDTSDGLKEAQNVSLTSFKLRRILAVAKELENQEGKMDRGLSPSSQLILSLLNNVLTCPTGQEDGIDATYRLLTNRRGASETELQQERLKEEMHEFFKEEMRCLRERLLNGEGPVVRSLLKVLETAKVEEPPHQAKYLSNLLGAEIGTFLIGKSISFDQSAGCVLPALRECNKQTALDTLYKHHTPQTVIAYFQELLNSKGIMGKIDGKNTLATIMGEFLTYEQQGDAAYIVFDAFDTPIGLTPLGTAEILLKTHIFEVVEKD